MLSKQEQNYKTKYFQIQFINNAIFIIINSYNIIIII